MSDTIDLAETFTHLADMARQEGIYRKRIYNRLVRNDIVYGDWADQRISDMFMIGDILEALAATDGKTALKIYALAQELASARDAETESVSG